MCDSVIKEIRKRVKNLKRVKKTRFSENALTTMYGINVVSARKINALMGNHPRHLQAKLNLVKVMKIMVEPSINIEFPLRRVVFRRLCSLFVLRTYRGSRILQGLPSRGQKTKRNSKTPERMLTSQRYLPFEIEKLFYLREDYKIKKGKKKKKQIQGIVRMFKKGKKGVMSKTKAKKVRKLKAVKKKKKSKFTAKYR